MAPAVQQSGGGGGGGGGSTAAVGSTTRWCPTAEQLMILEEMYRGGLRTPNAAQIQQITAHLSSYGRIEGKNVFYWFQNHKARDRQKLRRRLCISHHLLSCAHYYAAAHAHHLALSPTAAAAAAAAIPPPPLSSPLAAAPPLLPLHPSSCGAGLDHPNSLLSPTSATTPAAAAAYTTSFYYPFATATEAAAAPPPPRTSPASPLFHYNQGGGGVVLPAAEAIGRSSDYSLGKLVDNFGVALEEAFPTQPQPLATTMTAVVDTAPATAVAAGGFCRPLKTLDLFPGGLKEEQHDVV